MIAFLEGTLVTGGTEAIVSVGGGVGLDVKLSALSAEALPAPGQPVHLWTHLAVREDNWSLYGFVEAEERAMFRLLISVSGVGPKVAMGMLSRATGRQIAAYLRTGDEKALIGLPGIAGNRQEERGPPGGRVGAKGSRGRKPGGHGRRRRFDGGNGLGTGGPGGHGAGAGTGRAGSPAGPSGRWRNRSGPREMGEGGIAESLEESLALILKDC